MDCVCVFFFKQNTAYDMRISYCSSDVCSSDLMGPRVKPACAKPKRLRFGEGRPEGDNWGGRLRWCDGHQQFVNPLATPPGRQRCVWRHETRSEERRDGKE